jgi:hypothetical protein
MISTDTLRRKALLGMAYEKAIFELGAEGDDVIEKSYNVLEWLHALLPEFRIDVGDYLLLDKLRIREKDGTFSLWVLCNDLFAWACADGEDFDLSDMPEFRRAMDQSPEHGELLWCCRKRGMRPQGPYYKRFSEAEKALFDAAGPERKEGEG